MAKKTNTAKTVIVGTYRPENEAWIAERRLYNLPLPSVLSRKERKGRKDGRAACPHAAANGEILPFHKAVSGIVLFAEGHRNFAFKARFKEVVGGAWLVKSGYNREGRAPSRPHGAAYALYDLLDAVSKCSSLSRDEAMILLNNMIDGKRLKDISDLPLDLAC